MKKPLLGYIDKKKLSASTYRTFIPISLGFGLMCLPLGLHLLYWQGVIGVISGTLCLLLCPSHLFVAFLFWRLTVVARTPGWQGDRWFQPKVRHGDIPGDGIGSA